MRFFVTVEPLSTTNISSTYPPGSNYMSKCAGDLREKTHEVWTRNSNRSRRMTKKPTGGHNAPPHGIRVKTMRMKWRILKKLTCELTFLFLKGMYFFFCLTELYKMALCLYGMYVYFVLSSCLYIEWRRFSQNAAVGDFAWCLQRICGKRWQRRRSLQVPPKEYKGNVMSLRKLDELERFHNMDTWMYINCWIISV